MTSKNNGLSAALVSNLQDVLSKRKGVVTDGSAEEPPSTSDAAAKEEEKESDDDSKPIVLVTNGDGIDSPGLVSLVEALVREGLYNVHVCAPQTDKSASSHSMTPGETISASSVNIKGATAFEVSGTPVDCISLGLSGALFAWSKPILVSIFFIHPIIHFLFGIFFLTCLLQVISGINQGSNCGHQIFYSGAVAAAREALISGVPSLSISLNWKKDESQESDFKDAVGVCLPLINATIRDIEKGVFPKDCSLNIEIPTSPSSNKGFKVTKQSVWRKSPSWQAVSANRHPGAGNFMSNQQSLGAQLAQLGRDASAAGAARRFTTQKKSIVEIESVGVAGKTESRVKKYFRLEFVAKEEEHTDDDLDIKALEDCFVSVTPLSLLPNIDPETQAVASEWIYKYLNADQ
ncbi:5'-nucleotidase SurE isoform X1 [Brassica rapa]|uniref:5'-nucleotidase SurE isoform X1 n=1 Tax=Brassica campestris TaxID=3711 RepID=UPI00142D692D|nr:5'-nucleotidase SurE isoform X1 [Brassica rapa]